MRVENSLYQISIISTMTAIISIHTCWIILLVQAINNFQSEINNQKHCILLKKKKKKKKKKINLITMKKNFFKCL